MVTRLRPNTHNHRQTKQKYAHTLFLSGGYPKVSSTDPMPPTDSRLKIHRSISKKRVRFRSTLLSFFSSYPDKESMPSGERARDCNFLWKRPISKEKKREIEVPCFVVVHARILSTREFACTTAMSMMRGFNVVSRHKNKKTLRECTQACRLQRGPFIHSSQKKIRK